MTAGELAVLLAAVMCCIGFAALVVVLMRVLDTLKALREEVGTLRAETRPLLTELRTSKSLIPRAMDVAVSMPTEPQTSARGLPSSGTRSCQYCESSCSA